MSPVQSSEEIEKLIGEKTANLVEGGQDSPQREEPEIDRSTFSGTPYDNEEVPLPYSGEHTGINSAAVCAAEMVEKYGHHPIIEQTVNDLVIGRLQITPEDLEGARANNMSVAEAIVFRRMASPHYLKSIDNEERGDLLRTRAASKLKVSDDWLAEIHPQYFSPKELRQMKSRRIQRTPDKLDDFQAGTEAMKEDLKRQVEAEGLEWNEEGWEQYKETALANRSKVEVPQILKKQGESFARKITDWAGENLSEHQWARLSADERAIAYISGGGEVTSEEVATLFDPKTGTLRPFVKDMFDEPLRPPIVDEATGELKEIPKKKKAAPAALTPPTEKELKTMTSEEIAKHLPFTKVEDW